MSASWWRPFPCRPPVARVSNSITGNIDIIRTTILVIYGNIISNDLHYQDMEKNNVENEAQSLATLLSDKAKDIKLNMLTPMLLTRTQTTRLFITRFRHKNVSLEMFRFVQNILLFFIVDSL